MISAGAVPRPRWGSFSASPSPLAVFKGLTSKGREGKKRGEREHEWKGIERGIKYGEWKDVDGKQGIRALREGERREGRRHGGGIGREGRNQC